MAHLIPLPSRLIQPRWVNRVPAPAHDSLSAQARRDFLAANPDSYLTVTRAPEDLGPGEVWDVDKALDASRTALNRLITDGAFSPVNPPGLYLYRLTRGDHQQTAIVGGVATADYHDGTMRIHEEVQPARAEHLARHLDGLRVQSSPIALAHRPDDVIDEIVSTVVKSTAPAIAFSNQDDLVQEVWALGDDRSVAAVTDALADEPVYLIDGHHRAAAAARFEATTTAEGAGLVLCALFPSDQLRIDAFHRCLPSLDAAEFLQLLSRAFPVRTAPDIETVMQRTPTEIAITAGSAWYLIDLPVTEGEGLLVDLDPVRLDRHVLRPLLGIDSSAPGDDLAYTHSSDTKADLEHLAATGATICVMRPIPIESLMAASDAGLLMPPKSTYFQPKVRSGVFLRPIG